MKSNLPAMQPSTEVEYSSHSNISTHCGLASTAQPWFDRGGFTLIIADTHSRQQTLKSCGLIIGLGGWLLPHTAFGWTGHPALRARFLLSPSCLHSGAVDPTLSLFFFYPEVSEVVNMLHLPQSWPKPPPWIYPTIYWTSLRLCDGCLDSTRHSKLSSRHIS